jgi:RecA-family ATPase
MSNPEQDIVVVDEFYGKYKINEFYRDPAEKLVRKFDQLKHIPVVSILFVENLDGKGKSKNKVKLAEIRKIPERWYDLIYQMTGRKFEYMIEFYRENIERKTPEQILIALYHELRHIGPSGDLIHHDHEDFSEIAGAIGFDWSADNRFFASILAEGVNWDTLDLQTRLFGEENTNLRRVK